MVHHWLKWLMDFDYIKIKILKQNSFLDQRFSLSYSSSYQNLVAIDSFHKERAWIKVLV